MKPKLKIKAKELIAKSPDGKIAMIGHPGDRPPSNDPTMTAAVQATCDGCTTEVWATELKVAIKELSPDSVILCVKCMTAYLKAGQTLPLIIKSHDKN